MDYDVERVRASFPALRDGTAYFDGPGGSQVPRQVAHAVASTMAGGLSNRGTVTASERRAEEVVVGARAAMADLLGCDPGGVVFGRSMTQLTFDLARALAKTWEPGDEVVVTRLDHDANIRPWKRVADALGMTVRWVDFDTETAELSSSTRRCCPSGPGSSRSPARRTCSAPGPTSPASRPRCTTAGALLFVDGVHLTPHAPVAVRDLGADFYACSPYKFFGPHLGVLAADPALLELVQPDKLLPSTDQVPERFELGTLPYELLAGVTATVDFIADLAPGGADRAAGPGARVHAAGRGLRGGAVRAAAVRARRGRRGTPLRPPRPSYADGAVLGRGPHRPRGARGARRPAA